MASRTIRYFNENMILAFYKNQFGQIFLTKTCPVKKHVPRVSNIVALQVETENTACHLFSFYSVTKTLYPNATMRGIFDRLELTIVLEQNIKHNERMRLITGIRNNYPKFKIKTGCVPESYSWQLPAGRPYLRMQECVEPTTTLQRP